MAKSNDKKNGSHKTPWIIAICAALFVFLITGIWTYLDTSRGQDSTLTEDTNMTTNRFDSDITLLDNAGISVTETLDVSFSPKRHGIYRYVRNQGQLAYTLNGTDHVVPYTAYVSEPISNIAFTNESEGDFSVFKFGNADQTISGETYQYSYEIIPTFDKDDLQVAYANLFPSRWQNRIPAGSTFTLHFPHGYDRKKLQFYYGEYGSTMDGTEILDLTYGEDMVSGVLKEDLPLGYGITLFSDMGKGYFTNIQTNATLLDSIFSFMRSVLIFVILLFLAFGISRKPVTSIQYSAPQGQDSATLGYILDGKVDSKDLLSLFLYWADQGYVQIQKKGREPLTLNQMKELPESAPLHQITLFKALFRKSKTRPLEHLGPTLSSASSKATNQIYDLFTKKQDGPVFSKISTIPRRIAFGAVSLAVLWYVVNVWGGCMWKSSFMFFSLIDIIIIYFGMARINHSIRNWYSSDKKRRLLSLFLSCMIIVAAYVVLLAMNKALVHANSALDFTSVGIWMIPGTIIASVFASCIRRRTKRGTELMGWILGIRNFIETAELRRIDDMAEEHPEWFYHLLPYAYVMGLTDTWVHRLNALGVEINAPQWYEGSRNNTFMQDGVFDPYAFYQHFDTAAVDIKTSIDRTIAAEASSKSSGGSGGSSGGFSDSDSGGFSDGGFGGGGGGSW